MIPALTVQRVQRVPAQSSKGPAWQAAALVLQTKMRSLFAALMAVVLHCSAVL
ncbi:hypothetical protein CLOSTMETH_03920 [[Clostridium] methylpentosum DSM 5476]|uniref:Uncharacterized protein n=1 Tax=[Clostridium] methylpentosum DSM 5476 TaxID=537013 RepID=C0EJ69_9FIRM|nr:hypothetical protein CLOSTMETH_03920 [[Clostridium] methylpentosum DSM 5476]